MEMTLQVLTVLVLGVATLWSAVPVGLLLGLDGWTTGMAAAGGAGLGTLLVLSLSDRLRRQPPAAASRAATRSRGLLQRAWTCCGVPGLGLLAPLLIGAPLGAAVGVLLGASVPRLALWLTIGIVLCSAGLTGLATLGSGMLLALAQAATGVLT